MSLTPSNSRMMSPAWGTGSLKLTPSNSPFAKQTPLRSPIKNIRPEVTLALKQVIGTTANSANAFDSRTSGTSFAFTAGAAAVVATVDAEHTVTQKFYRARPTTNPVNPSASVYGGPSTPTQNEARNRTTASLRDAGLGVSPLASPANEWSDAFGIKTSTARDRVKAATCVSFSPDGKFLAVGETGYKPRVLIFSTSAEAPSDTPLTSITDHTFGVCCVAFSTDSQYLATLGASNDGFLYIWNINPRSGAATLHASSKCTSHINRMAWLGNSLITVGTRHVKVWRIDDQTSTVRSSKPRQSDIAFLSSSIHKTLPGRNCLLENLLDSNFTSVASVAPAKAIVGSDKGDICLIDDTDGTQRFSKIAEAGFSITSMAADSKGRLHLAGDQGGLKTLNINETLGNLTPPPSPPPRVESPTVTLGTNCHQIQAVGTLVDYIVTVDSERSIRLSNLCAPDDESIVGDVVQKLPAHGDAVLGVASLAKSNTADASFYTWSAGGSILFWTPDGSCVQTLQVPLEQLANSDVEPNELRTVCTFEDATYLVTGDRYGVLRIINMGTKSSEFDFKAHGGEITDISIFEGRDAAYIACSGRDRVVQIFTRKNDAWDLMQTLDEHVGAVTGLLFSRDGTRLVSCSSDRSLVVRKFVSREDEGETICAFIILRTVTLKAAPISMVWDIDQTDVMLVSTMDRQVHKYSLRNGHCISSFKATDTDGGDAVVLSSLAHIPRPFGPPVIAGVSNTAEKSIRLYDESGTLLARDWGHTEGVTAIALMISQRSDENDGTPKSVVTVAADGTTFIWNLDFRTPNRQDMSKSIDPVTPLTPTNHDLLASRPPLRRVFSQSELARLQRSPEDDNATPTGNRSPKLRKRLSKFSLAQAPRLEPSPISNLLQDNRGSMSRRSYRNRSPSPPSPRNPQISKRRSSIDVRARTKPPANEFGSLGASTESLCRTLRAYRKRLANTTDTIGSELVREVERELAQTARAIGERAKSKGLDETAMVKLLDQYSERLVTMLDEKIAANVSVALRVRENSETGLSSGLATPAVDGEDGYGREADRGTDDSTFSSISNAESIPPETDTITPREEVTTPLN
ncbi:WD repeat protein-like protein [Lophiostoma macrostomum CBS 122681]|uniref:WD repeat protein-like protein n=1 Tax=Lophiostoma macrostomum CBS 122681 TaxID=1314788 RepID=A0A6A6SWH4_9PLEO|nr:WD repeat protein-like protein [Lophiostoma macrostomum CBS 122681]